MIINRIPLSHTTSSSQAHSGNEKNKFVQHSDARYIEGDFDPPFAGVRRRLLLVGRTQDRRRLPSQINARAESPLRGALHAWLSGEPKESKLYMTAETEMDHFFARNCYTEAERTRVKAWHPYQAAMEKNDIVEAQEIAMRVLERGLGIVAESRHPSANF